MHIPVDGDRKTRDAYTSQLGHSRDAYTSQLGHSVHPNLTEMLKSKYILNIGSDRFLELMSDVSKD
jgi:hypothetical protein